MSDLDAAARPAHGGYPGTVLVTRPRPWWGRGFTEAELRAALELPEQRYLRERRAAAVRQVELSVVAER